MEPRWVLEGRCFIVFVSTAVFDCFDMICLIDYEVKCIWQGVYNNSQLHVSETYIDLDLTCFMVLWLKLGFMIIIIITITIITIIASIIIIATTFIIIILYSVTPLLMLCSTDNYSQVPYINSFLTELTSFPGII